jgi:hypothetical protein
MPARFTTGLRTQFVTRAETRAETEQRLARFVAFATSFFDPINDMLAYKSLLRADVLDTWIR